MKTRLITPVGTSLFTNYKRKKGGGSFGRHWPRIKDERGKRQGALQNRIDRLRSDQDFVGWIARTDDTSAEIESTRKIVASEEGTFQVVLIASDTVASRLAAELIEEHAEVEGADFTFNTEHDQVEDLQVFDAKAFKNGVRNLTERVRGLLEERGELMGQEGGGTCMINLTGGYKATLPYLTLLGEIYDVPLRYKSEDADAYLSIPQAPITVDQSLFRNFESEFKALSDGVYDWAAFEEQNYHFAQRAGDLIEQDDNMAYLSPLGKLFWSYYTDQYVFFYAPDDIYKQIRDEQPNVQRILRTKMKQIRDENQMEMKENHLVFDDGPNSNRIYYFIDGEDLYLYKTFDEREEHDDHEAYYKSASFDDDFRRSVIDRSKRRRFERNPA